MEGCEDCSWLQVFTRIRYLDVILFKGTFYLF